MSTTQLLLFVVGLFCSFGITAIAQASRAFDRRFNTDSDGIPKRDASQPPSPPGAA